MKNLTLLEKLAAIPQDATQATIAGVKMEVINVMEKDRLLQADPDDIYMHECILANGNFLFVSRNGELKKVYKVM